MTTTYYLGVDTGGTFTDFYWQGPSDAGIHKVLSTPDAPERAILQGVEELGLSAQMTAGELVIVHGSTVATNAALEGKGARTVFITNEGFKDLLMLSRQNRDTIYALYPQTAPVPLAEDMCLEVACRRDSSGRILTPLTDGTLQRLGEQLRVLQPEAVAINLLYSFLNNEDERRVMEAVPPGVMACCSSDVLPEYREYERGVATWLNAWLGPRVARYLDSLRRHVSPTPLAIMQSSGGTIAADQAAQRAVNLLLSGPAGGLAAAQRIGELTGAARLLTFDMGGTSTDVALIEGKIRLTTEGRLAHYPVAVPMVDMHTIGAGGGSIAYLDQAKLLHVGPQSAGASPGPACYGLGGRSATVTDANAVLGRLRPEHFLGGRLQLDLAATRQAVGELADSMGVDLEAAALGVIALANEHMARALRVISVQRGHNPRQFELCCFGGAGGLHVCALADELGVTRVLIPCNGGVLSAYGMLVAGPQRQLSRTLRVELARVDVAEVRGCVTDLIQAGQAALRSEGVVAEVNADIHLDCRYTGQSFTLSLPWRDELSTLADDFHVSHEIRYGHSLSLPIEIVNVRVQVQAPSPLAQPVPPKLPSEHGRPREVVDLPFLGRCDVWARADLAAQQLISGPAIICEEVATTLLPANWSCRQDEWGNLRLQREKQV